MSNIRNYNSNKLDFKLSGSQYYDFYLNSDAIKNTEHYDSNRIASFDFSVYDESDIIGDFHYPDFDEFDFHVSSYTNADFNNPDFNSFDFLTGDGFNFLNNNNFVSEITWSGAYSNAFNATTYGLTGIDNFSIPYDPSLDDYTHTALVSTLTGSSLTHTIEDDKLSLNQVSGATGNYVYDSTITMDDNGNYLSLCGGFLQGYYKLDGYGYQSLPTRYEKGWTLATWIRPTNCRPSGQILNDTYPDNEGFFYYNGTRAENKFWSIFSGNTTDACASGSTGLCTEIKETDMLVSNIMVGGEITEISVPLSPPPVDVKLIENNFLLFGRSNGYQCAGDESVDGYGQVRADEDYDRNDKYYSKIVRRETTNFTNQFLIYGRSNGYQCAGDESEDGYGQQRADDDWDGTTEPVLELDKDTDLTDNAFGLRIKPDGSIGYRLLTLSGDCQSVEIVEEYSDPDLINPELWSHVVVKWVNNDQYSECELETDDARMGKLKFYVNSRLLFVSKDLLEQLPKRLDDLSEKQVGVPYNISIGGGTQGLIESMTFDGQDPDDLGLIVEQNFAGSFIGDISSFDLFDKNLSWCQIKDIYNNTKTKYI